MYYTNVTTNGSQILERYTDDNGKDCYRKVDFAPSLFKHSPNGNLKDIYGKSVQEVEFENMAGARAWMKSMKDINRECLGQDDFILQYAYNTYPDRINYNTRDLDIGFLDIEVPTNGPFPKPSICKWEIDAICQYSTKRDTFHLFTTRPWDKAKSVLIKDDDGKDCDILDRVEYRFYATEKEMLIGYLRFFREFTPHVLTGWNTEKFDIPYIVRRMSIVLGEKFAQKLSPWDKVKEKLIIAEDGDEDDENDQTFTYDITGVSCIDYMNAYKKFTFTTRPSYKLDYIGMIELGMRKLGMSHKTYLAFSQNDPQRYIDYNIRDVDLLTRLDNRLSLFELIISIGYYAKINFANTFSPIKTWDAIIHNSLIIQGIVVPENKTEVKQRYAGAFVKDPIMGFKRWILSFDLTSLYPHEIFQYNISPETLVDQYPMTRTFIKDRFVTELTGMGVVDGTWVVPHEGYSFAPNGCRYRKDKRGILPIEIEKVFLQRKAAKKAEFHADKLATAAYNIIVERTEAGIAVPETVQYKARFDFTDEELHQLTNAQLEQFIKDARHEEKMQNVMQQARKVLINSAYGACGSAFFRYYDTRLAESITTGGQLSIRWIMRKMNEYMNRLCSTADIDYIVYGDTDSIYVNFEPFVNIMAAKKGCKPEDIETIKWVDFLDKFAKTKVEPFINESYEELAVYMNAYDQRMFMDREIIADTAFWTKKKRYAANVWDSEGKRQYDEHGNVVPKLKIMGIETQRSSTPVFAGKSLKEAIKIILTKGEKALQDHVAEVKAAYPKKDYREIASVSSANNIEKNHNNYVPVSGCPGHIKAALAYNKTAALANVSPIADGEKIQVIMLKEPNKLHSPTLAFPSGETIPAEFGLDIARTIDYIGMYNKHFLKPMNVLCGAVGWNSSKVVTLSSMFDF